ncbi:MAG: hypothetical protein ACTSSJ_03430 [Candidatus Odinarchaeia archaeon]
MMLEEFKILKLTCSLSKSASVDEFSRFFFYINNIYKLIFLDHTGEWRKTNLDFFQRRQLREKDKLLIKTLYSKGDLVLELLVKSFFASSFGEVLTFIREVVAGGDSPVKEIKIKVKNAEVRSKVLSEIKKIIGLKDIKIKNVEIMK